jgi:hypothetical protein
MANPGPASANTPNYVVVPQNGLRLLAFAKAVSLATAGDTAMTMQTSTGNILPLYVITANSAQGTTVSVATATVGVYTGAGQTGTTILTTAALTSQSTAVYVKSQAPTNATTMIYGNSPNTTNASNTNSSIWYVNVGTTVAGGVIDVYVYGFDLT